MVKRVMVIGLDCADPKLVFEKFKGKLPNISKLMNQGFYGQLESTIPPITCPAWMCMVTGKNPGQLGVYGFRSRNGHDYKGMVIADSSQIKEKKVWDLLSEQGKKVMVIGVPQTFPPQPVNGYLVTSFLTPGIESNYTYPTDFKEEIKQVVGKYMLDVENFRTDNKDIVLKEIYDMTEKRFKLAKHLIRNKDWNLFFMVEMGTDRIHHAFWKYLDETHKKFEAGSKYENAILDYYKYLDEQIGELMQLIDADTAVMIVSDHGAKKMDGCICLNEWLIENGYLKLKNYPQTQTRLDPDNIDWSKTKAWGWGGYYGRIFLNVKGREANGIIEPEDYEKERNELIEKLEDIRDEKGNKLDTKVLKPEETYAQVNGNPADLMAFFGDLAWRSLGSVGHRTILRFDNDTGPDDAMHDWHGIFILYNPKKKVQNHELKGVKLIDIAPTILELMGFNAPQDIEGKAVKEVVE